MCVYCDSRQTFRRTLTSRIKKFRELKLFSFAIIFNDLISNQLQAPRIVTCQNHPSHRCTAQAVDQIRSAAEAPSVNCIRQAVAVVTVLAPVVETQTTAVVDCTFPADSANHTACTRTRYTLYATTFSFYLILLAHIKYAYYILSGACITN